MKVMVITYYNASCFKVQSGDTVLLFDPPSKNSGFKTPRFQTDIVFISHNHENHNGHENIPSKTEEAPFVITGPGEYEVKNTVIRGIKTFHDSDNGKKHGLNTAYVVNFENTRICHLGDFGEQELRPETQEALGEIDILLMPINGAIVGAERAVKLINQIEPKIIIPMHYFAKNFVLDKKALSDFLKEIGQEKANEMEKLTLRKKDIGDKKEEVTVLSPSL